MRGLATEVKEDTAAQRLDIDHLHYWPLPPLGNPWTHVGAQSNNWSDNWGRREPIGHVAPVEYE